MKEKKILLFHISEKKVEIKYDSMEYDFTINGATGVIVERSSESVYD